MEDQQVEVAEEIVMEAGAMPQSPTNTKKKRSKKQVKYLTNRGRRRAFDKTKLESLATMLDEWFTRTKLPVVAISLDKDLHGEMGVRFTGKEVFADFVRDEDVRKRFVEVVIEGLKKTEEPNTVETKDPGCGRVLVDILLAENVLRFSVQDKRSLLTDIITQHRSKGSGSAWLPERKPSWWNAEHWSFESPNNGTPRMSVDALDALLADCVEFYKRTRAREETSEEGSSSEERMQGEIGEDHQQSSGVVGEEEGVDDFMVNEEGTAEVGRTEVERTEVECEDEDELEGQEREADLEIGRNVEVTELGIENEEPGEGYQRDGEGRSEILETTEGREQKMNEEDRSNIEEEVEEEHVEARTMKGRKREKMSKRKEKKEPMKKRKRMLEDCIEQASNGQLGESSSREELDCMGGNVDEESFELLCRHSSWSAESCEENMEAVKLDSWHTVSKFVQLIPETLPYDHVKRSFHHHDIDLWVRHLLPEEERLQGFQPVTVTRDAQQIYRCLSKIAFKTESFWPTMKLETLRYAVLNESDILSKLQTEEDVLQLFTESLRAEVESIGSLQKLYRKELMHSFQPKWSCSPIHLLLASEAFSKTIRILATSFGKQYSFGNGEAAFKFMRTPSKLGAPSNHLVPLVRDDSLSSRYPTTRSKPSSPCAAADQCAVLVRVNPSLTFLQCRHCLRDFHSTCAISEEVGTADSVWFCGCAYEAEDLKQTSRFSSVREVKKMLATHKVKVQDYISALNRGKMYCKRMALFRNGNFVDLKGESSSQGWQLNSNTIDVILQQCSKLMKGTDETHLFRLQMDVLLPEVLSLLVHLEEGIPMIAARRICSYLPNAPVPDNSTPKRKRKQKGGDK